MAKLTKGVFFSAGGQRIVRKRPLQSAVREIHVTPKRLVRA
jgi:hypothetical protein